MTTILGVRLNDRVHDSVIFQKIISEFGCDINTRIGLHRVHNDACPRTGVILMEIIHNEKAVDIEKALLQIENIEIQRMVFE